MIVFTLNSYLGRTTLAGVVGLAALVGSQAKADLVYGVSDELGQLVSFNSASPGTLLSAIALTGTETGEQIRGIDDVSGVIYGLGDANHLYTINPATGVCTMVGAGAFSPVLNGIDFGFTAGPSQFYVSSDLGQNLSLTTAGVATTMPNYTGASLDTIAYDPLTSVYYGMSASSQDLYTVNPATGSTTLVGPTGVDFIARDGLDITASGAAYFSATVNGQTEFFTANLLTGALTLVGDVGTPGEVISGLDSITVVPTTVPEPGTMALATLGGGLLLFMLRRRK